MNPPFPGCFPPEIMYEICQYVHDTLSPRDLLRWRMTNRSCHKDVLTILRPNILTLSSEREWELYFSPFSDGSNIKEMEKKLSEMSKVSKLEINCIPPCSISEWMEKAREMSEEISPLSPLFCRLKEIEISNVNFGAKSNREYIEINHMLNHLSTLMSPTKISIDLSTCLSFYTHKDNSEKDRPTLQDYLSMNETWDHPYFLLLDWTKGWSSLHQVEWIGVPFRGSLGRTIPGLENIFDLASCGFEIDEWAWDFGQLFASFIKPYVLSQKTRWRFKGLTTGLEGYSDIHDFHRKTYVKSSAAGKKTKMSRVNLQPTLDTVLGSRGWSEAEITCFNSEKRLEVYREASHD